MFIKKVWKDYIEFENGSILTSAHLPDWCEYNYADFMQLEQLALAHDFDKKLRFEYVDDCGFRFGDKHRMFFVPCYSMQNGYYSSVVDIWYNDKIVLEKVESELI